MQYVFPDKCCVDHEIGNLSAVFPIRKEFEVFRNHFPGFPVFPGALILEIVVRHGLLLLRKMNPLEKNDILKLMSIERVKFKKIITPDCDLNITIKKVSAEGNLFKLSARVSIHKDLYASALLTIKRVIPEQ